MLLSIINPFYRYSYRQALTSSSYSNNILYSRLGARSRLSPLRIMLQSTPLQYGGSVLDIAFKKLLVYSQQGYSSFSWTSQRSSSLLLGRASYPFLSSISWSILQRLVYPITTSLRFAPRKKLPALSNTMSVALNSLVNKSLLTLSFNSKASLGWSCSSIFLIIFQVLIF